MFHSLKHGSLKEDLGICNPYTNSQLFWLLMSRRRQEGLGLHGYKSISDKWVVTPNNKRQVEK
jgi:hypothetical protein